MQISDLDDGVTARILHNKSSGPPQSQWINNANISCRDLGHTKIVLTILLVLIKKYRYVNPFTTNIATHIPKCIHSGSKKSIVTSNSKQKIVSQKKRKKRIHDEKWNTPMVFPKPAKACEGALRRGDTRVNGSRAIHSPDDELVEEEVRGVVRDKGEDKVAE